MRMLRTLRRVNAGGVVIMRVEFYKFDSGRLCGWFAAPPKRRAFQGTVMASGRDIPHDLNQFVIERELGIADGFWGLLSHGASFTSVASRRQTKPGRELQRLHHDALLNVEYVVNEHFGAWRRQAPTPLKAALDVVYARWMALREDEPLALEWPMRPLAKIAKRTR
jgi:hypothetical protein